MLYLKVMVSGSRVTIESSLHPLQVVQGEIHAIVTADGQSNECEHGDELAGGFADGPHKSSPQYSHYRIHSLAWLFFRYVNIPLVLAGAGGFLQTKNKIALQDYSYCLY